MDGGGRLGGSLTSGLFGGRIGSGLSQPPVLGGDRPRRWFGRRSSVSIPLDRRIPKGFGTALALVFLSGVALAGAIMGGQLSDFRSHYGDARDVAARAVGLGIERVTISGLTELAAAEVLADAGITPKGSLAFFDAAEARRKLEATALIREASVRKLYPGEIAIKITEREPFALWQLNGEVSIVAGDGTVIDKLHDARFAHLPLVVGEGANLRVKEYAALISGLGPLRERVRGAILISGRRWTLKFDSGVDVHLPEFGTAEAVGRLAKLEDETKLLERSVLSVDLRQPDRVTLRLTEEAATARAEKIKPAKRKGGEA